LNSAVGPEVWRTVLALVTDFTALPVAAQQATLFAEPMFALLQYLFESCEAVSDAVLPQLFAAAESVVRLNRELLFDEQKYCQILVLPTLTLCNVESDARRDKAARFLWWLIGLNDEQKGSFGQVRLACTIAISRLVAENKASDTYRLKKSLDSVVASSTAKPHLSAELAEMMTRLFNVLKSR
jgi:hypothetical protein